MVLTIVLLLILIGVIALLFIPIDLIINTDTQQYFVRLKGILKVSIEPIKVEILRVKMRFLFMDYYFYPLKYKKKKNVKKIGKTFGKRKNEMVKIFRIINSFKIKKNRVNIDTGDVILNAKLYPAFAFLNYYVGNFNVNFKGRNQLVLHMQSKPIDIIKSIINIKK